MTFWKSTLISVTYSKVALESGKSEKTKNGKSQENLVKNKVLEKKLENFKKLQILFKFTKFLIF